MENFFSTVMYVVFGKRWVLHTMKEGLKMAVFVNEVELDMQFKKMKEANRALADTNLLIDELTKNPIKPEESEEELAKMKEEDPKKHYEVTKGAEIKNKEKLESLKEMKRQREQAVMQVDAEMNKINAITYGNRIKYDFIKSYKLK